MSTADYAILDPRFSRLINGTASLDCLWTGGRWTEGPAYVPAMRGLVWSDLPNDCMLFWHEGGGQVSTFRQPSNIGNGNTLDRQGRLVTCEHLTRRVSRTEHDGRIVTIAHSCEGKRLNSPNDVVVKSDNSIWFTDPSYGIVDDYQGRRSEQEIGGCHVYRVDAATGRVTVVADDFLRPNGLAFSPDERTLYVVDSGRTEGPENPVHIRAFTVTGDKLASGKLFAECTAGLFDGLRLDEAGRVWASAGDGVHCYEPDGTLIGKVLTPEPAANLVFGGPYRNRMFITATTSLYAIYLTTNGVATF